MRNNIITQNSSDNSPELHVIIHDVIIIVNLNKNNLNPSGDHRIGDIYATRDNSHDNSRELKRKML
jgi:hypothetical protein